MMTVLKLLSVHRFDFTHKDSMRNSLRKFHYLAYHISGKATHIMADKTLTADEGDMIFLNGCDKYYVEINKSGSSYVIAFEADDMPESFVLDCRNNEKIRSIWNRIIEHQNMEICSNIYYCLAKIYELFAYIQNIFEHDINEIQNPIYKISIAKMYIMNNYMNPDLCADEIAEKCSMSANYLRTTFGIGYGITPHKFLLEIRMKEAIRLIEHSKLSIKQISEKVGYKNTAYFSYSFKQYTNMSPSEYRNQNR